MRIDFNVLEMSAATHMKTGDYAKALAIYFFMADGDPSLDAGHLAERIATCYRALGDVHAAKYWYRRALEENPEVYKEVVNLVKELGDTDYEAFLVR
jgi:tetratricopeptide (TPR) repeat protein